MAADSDPLAVLLSIKNELQFDVDESLVRACYELQRDYQYDKDRNTLKKMQVLIEEFIGKNKADTLL